jgi:myo-inositol-1(or 4)-monophosphatase
VSRFIGEESVGDEGEELTNQPTWIVDPIDGTTNFVHRFPFTCVSIALAVQQEAVVGVVYNFVLDQMFAAKKGGGATMNGKQIHVSTCTEKTQALILTALGHQRSEQLLRSKLDAILDLAKSPSPVHGVLMTGSAAVNMCLVASGQADAYYEYGIHCWDIAAGDVIVREAGGATMMPNGNALDLMKRGILCSSSTQLASQLVPTIRHISQKD